MKDTKSWCKILISCWKVWKCKYLKHLGFWTRLKDKTRLVKTFRNSFTRNQTSVKLTHNWYRIRKRPCISRPAFCVQEKSSYASGKTMDQNGCKSRISRRSDKQTKVVVVICRKKIRRQIIWDKALLLRRPSWEIWVWWSFGCPVSQSLPIYKIRAASSGVTYCYLHQFNGKEKACKVRNTQHPMLITYCKHAASKTTLQKYSLGRHF